MSLAKAKPSTGTCCGEVALVGQPYIMSGCLRTPPVSTVLAGASRLEQVFESVKTLDAVHLLTDEAMSETERILQNKPFEAR
jgi:hypothetical protein